MKGHGFIAVIVVAALGSPVAQGPTPQDDSPAQSETVHIDDARNPELIPQWSAWSYAFRVIAGGPRELPSAVHQVVSKDEAAMVLKEADAVQEKDKTCFERLTKIYATLDREKPAVVDDRMHAVNVECRRTTLEARDRVLAALNPEGAAALVMFVESTKSGTTVTLPKRQLARFLEPE